MRQQNAAYYDEKLKDIDVNTEIYYPVSFHMQACFKDLGYREGLRQQNKP